SLLDLPDEIIEMIFSHLSLADQFRVRTNKRLRKIEERMEERGEGSKEELEKVFIVRSSPSLFSIGVNKDLIHLVPFPTVTTVLRRLNGHIKCLSLGIYPHDSSLIEQLDAVSNIKNNDIIIYDNLKELTSLPPLTVFDLAFFSRLIKNKTSIIICYLSLAMTNDDLIELNKVIGAETGVFSI
ncbi:hypothetical protein PFISCL1PPCAC_12222, partial [Pristionchus fissidentatus]